MRTSQELDQLRQQAVMLRRQGKSRIDVHRSADLYRKIEGWAAASMADGGPRTV